MGHSIRKAGALQECLDGAAANGVGTTIFVEEFRHLALVLSGEASANLTVKFQVSNQYNAPDFSAAQSSTNHWDYVECVDLEDGASIAGDTGVAFAAANDFRNLAINVDNVRYFNAIVSAFVDGTVTLLVKPSTNG